MADLAQELTAQGKKPYVIPVGGSNSVGALGYVAAMFELRWQLDQISPIEQVRTLDPEPVRAILDQAAADLKQCFPAFANMKIAERWAGLIDAMPDTVPVMSPVEKLPGFYLATGFSGHGFGLGPGAGKLMAQLVTGETPCVDPAPFRYSRYFDGSNPRPVTGL